MYPVIMIWTQSFAVPTLDNKESKLIFDLQKPMKPRIVKCNGKLNGLRVL
jgi:hypothetical protein